MTVPETGDWCFRVARAPQVLSQSAGELTVLFTEGGLGQIPNEKKKITREVTCYKPIYHILPCPQNGGFIVGFPWFPGPLAGHKVRGPVRTQLCVSFVGDQILGNFGVQ